MQYFFQKFEGFIIIRMQQLLQEPTGGKQAKMNRYTLINPCWISPNITFDPTVGIVLCFSTENEYTSDRRAELDVGRKPAPESYSVSSVYRLFITCRLWYSLVMKLRLNRLYLITLNCLPNAVAVLYDFSCFFSQFFCTMYNDVCTPFWKLWNIECERLQRR